MEELTRGQKISRSKMGHVVSQETREKIRAALKGKPISEKARKNRIGKYSGERKSNYGKIPSKETRIKLGLCQKGEKHHNWKGGITPITKLIRRSLYATEWRLAVFTRDIFTCKCCGAMGTYLEAHHIKPFSLILKENNILTVDEAIKCAELWDINNGITLCLDCHKKARGKKEQED